MEEMKLPESSLATLQGSVVHVSVPLSVAFDLDKIQRGRADHLRAPWGEGRIPESGTPGAFEVNVEP